MVLTMKILKQRLKDQETALAGLMERRQQLQVATDENVSQIIQVQGRIQEAQGLIALANQPEPEVSEPAEDQAEPTPT